MLEIGQATFHSPSGTFRADTCEPLRGAAERGAIDLWAYGRGTYPGTRLQGGVMPGLQSVGLWEADTNQDWGLDWHRNEGIEITCVTGGKTSFSCDEQEYELASGSVTITRPWQLHRIGRPDIAASSLCWFIIDLGVRRPNQDWTWPAWLPIPADDLARLTELLRHDECPVWRATRDVTRAVQRLERALKGEASQPLARIALCVSEILIEMVDLLEQQRKAPNPYLSSTERMVELFLTTLRDRLDKPWTVDAMAAACGLGRTRFIHYCRQVVNVSPLEYLTALRVEEAARLLGSGNLKVSEVAVRCGFQSSQYFSTVFRRRFGCPPRDVRASSRAGAGTSGGRDGYGDRPPVS